MNNNYNAPQDPQFGQPEQPQQPQYAQPQQPMYGQPQQPMYGQPQQPQFGQMPPSDGKGLSIAALVCGVFGILSILFSYLVVVTVIGLITTILGVVFGAMGRKRSMLMHGRPSGLATAGLVLGIIGLSFATLGLICSIACVSCYADLFGDLFDIYDFVY